MSAEPNHPLTYLVMGALSMDDAHVPQDLRMARYFKDQRATHMVIGEFITKADAVAYLATVAGGIYLIVETTHQQAWRVHTTTQVDAM